MSDGNERDFTKLRRKLIEKRDTIHERLRKIHSDVQKEDGPLDPDMEDQAIELENEDVLNALEPASRRELGKVLAALERMDEGKYGVCIDCGDEIAMGRLEAIPWALRCIECAEATEMQRGRP